MISYLPFWQWIYVVPSPRVFWEKIGVTRIVYGEGDARWMLPLFGAPPIRLTLAPEKGIDAAMNRALHLLRLS